jgi:hypothetical protein
MKETFSFQISKYQQLLAKEISRKNLLEETIRKAISDNVCFKQKMKEISLLNETLSGFIDKLQSKIK